MNSRRLFARSASFVHYVISDTTLLMQLDDGCCSEWPFHQPGHAGAAPALLLATPEQATHELRQRERCPWLRRC